MNRLKTIIFGWIAFKLVLLGVFWALTFSSCGPQNGGAATASPTPTPEPSIDESIDRPTSDPFSGNVERFEREGRAEKLQIGKVMDLLSIREGSKVADIGAGSGWFSAIASERVGEKGKVYAVDISEVSIKYIQDRIANEGLGNVETVLSKPEDPLLQGEQLNAVLILNTYHEIANPVRFLVNLRKGLKPGALVGIIDRDGSGGDHGLDSEKVVEEAARAGFALKDRHDFVKGDRMDYFLVFEIKESSE